MNHSQSSGPKPVVLFVLAGLAILFMGIAITAGLMTGRTVQGPGTADGPVEPTAENPPGAVIEDVLWNHLHHIDSFELTNQDGERFDTAQFSGDKPFLVSFFFATCPSICRDLNKQVAKLNEQLKKEDVAFVTITVDPERDTPEVLNRYAADFGAESPRWSFLTGEQYRIKEIGEQMFRVEVVDMANHTDNIMLVDKWGKFRDRFKWDEPYDMKRLVNVVKDVAAETEPPLNEVVRTRNALVGREPLDLSTIRYMREFHLLTSDEQPFFSRDLTGEVWIANFFFVNCPTTCTEQSKYLAGLQNRMGDNPTRVVSITTDPANDLPANLREYARKFDADSQRWLFLTGNEKAIPRIAGEFFSAMGGADHHSTELFVVDKWGNVRGRFSWQDPAQEVKMLGLVDDLWKETRPPADFEYVNGTRQLSTTEDYEEEDDE